MSTESALRPTKKPAKQSGLLTALCVLLVVVGIGVIVYPFALIAIEAYNKNQVVAQLEREFPIFRAEEDFTMLDEDAIAAMPVVDVPRWTTEEVAVANALLDSVDPLDDPLADIPFTPVTLPPIVSPTAPPDTDSVSVAAHGDIVAVELGRGLLAALPDPPMDAGASLLAWAGDSRVLGVSDIDEPDDLPTPRPTQAGASVSPTQAPLIAPPGASASPARAGLIALPAAQLIASLPLSMAGSASLLNASILPAAALDAIDGGDAAESDVDPRAAFQLRDATPVYYEDFARILDEANALAADLSTFRPQPEERRHVDSPIELTVASINSQIQAVRVLLGIFEALPGTANAVAPFVSVSDPSVVYNVSLRDGALLLASDLAALDQVIYQFARIKRFPRAHDQLQPGFDRGVELVDHTLNLLDHMARQLNERDTEAYQRGRSASMVGETEAVYLLELPSLRIKVGCFPNLTFEQMYKGMRKGVALYPRVGTPNTNTNISVIGHRAGSAPFFEHLDRLKPGDTVLLHSRGLGSYRYLVERVFVVEEDDWTPMHNLGYPSITLVSCEEFGGVIYGRRIMAHCKLVGIAQ